MDPYFYDYSNAGLDSFLSRSIDSLPQANLSSQGPLSTQTRFDFSQISGGMGDNYRMGGIGMSARDSSITLNNGQLIINNTSDDNTITLADGVESFEDTNHTKFRIGSLGAGAMGQDITDSTGFVLFKQDGQTWTWYNKTTNQPIAQLGKQTDGTYTLTFLDAAGNVVAKFGQQTDNAIALKFFDAAGLGLAQFGKFADDTFALKVAKAGIEVSSATNDQLVFNSGQNVFKIVKTGTLSVPGGSFSTGSNQYSSLTPAGANVAHGLGFIPAFLAFDDSGGASYTLLPNTLTAPQGTNYFANFTLSAFVDNTNFGVSLTGWGFNSPALGTSFTYPTSNVRYYLLQETAN